MCMCVCKHVRVHVYVLCMCMCYTHVSLLLTDAMRVCGCVVSCTIKMYHTRSHEKCMSVVRECHCACVLHVRFVFESRSVRALMPNKHACARSLTHMRYNMLLVNS